MMKSLAGACAALLLSGAALAQTLPSPQVATPATTDNSTRAANTAWVRSYLGGGGAATSVAGFSGAVSASEIESALTTLNPALEEKTAHLAATPGADPTATTDSTAALNAALANPAIALVNLDHGRFLINSATVTVPPGKGITCASRPQIPALLNYAQQPCLILLNPAYSVSLGSGAWLNGVIVLADAAPVLAMTNAPTLRQNLTLINYMHTTAAGTGIVANNGSDVQITHSMVLGFNRCLSAQNQARYRFSDLYLDCDSGVQVTQTYDNGQFDRVRVHPFLTTANMTAVTPLYDVTAIGSDAGQFQLTLAEDATSNQPFAFQNGDWVNVYGVTGVTAINQFWAQITDVNATTDQITLAGSTYAAGGSGGKVTVNGTKRFGIGQEILGGSGVNMFAPWVLGHDTAFHFGDYVNGSGVHSNLAWVNVSQLGVDNDLAAYDPATVGLLVDGATQWLNVSGCSFSSQGTAVVFNSTGGGLSALTDCMVANNGAPGSALLNMQSGGLAVTASQLENSSILVGAGATELDFCGNSGTGTTITYASAGAQTATHICSSETFPSGMGAQQNWDSVGNFHFTLSGSGASAHAFDITSQANGVLQFTDRTTGTGMLYGTSGGVTVQRPLFLEAGITPATATATGGVMVPPSPSGAGNLSVDGSGNLSVPIATTSQLGVLKPDGTTLAINSAGVASVVPGGSYTLPDATATTLGGVTVSTGLDVSSGALSVAYGTAAGTAAEGNDARITGALQAANNLSDVAAAATARTNLGLGALATAGYPAAGIVASSGSALSPVTIGSGLSYASGTLSATGGSAAPPFPAPPVAGHVILPPGSLVWNNLTSAPSPPLLVALPIYLSAAGAPTGIAIIINSAPSVAWSARFGLYADNGSMQPGALVSNSDTGTITISTTPSWNVADAGLTGVGTLAPGWYWLAVFADGAWYNGQMLSTSLSVFASSGPVTLVGSYVGDNVMSAGGVVSGAVPAFGPLPATFPSPTAPALNISLPVVALGF